MAYLPKRENPILSKPGRRHGIRTLTYLGLLEVKKKRKNRNGYHTRCGKKGSDLTKQEEKMTNAPVRTAASEPGNTSQHTTETKKVELNKLCSNTVYIFN